jgi:MgsA AAA+ ATPase C terminal
MFPAQFQELLSYPNNKWGENVSERWVSLCTALRDYEAPCRSLAINKERKWELVSAFQKSIRRGDKQMALRLISAMDSMPEEYAYCWRRLCVIACEDVGPADDVLASFVVACATVFPPKKTAMAKTTGSCASSLSECEISRRAAAFTAVAGRLNPQQ